MNTQKDPAAQKNTPTPDQKGRRHDSRPRFFGKGSRGKKHAQKDSRLDLAQKVINVRRVARVVAGGRRFNFSVVVVLGDKVGSVGVGIGKGGDTAIAIEKALRNAKKMMMKVKTTKTMSIPHEVHSKYASAEVLIIPVPGKGLVAGSAVRTVLEHAGVTDVTAKIFTRSKNKLNIARATIEALKQLK